MFDIVLTYNYIPIKFKERRIMKYLILICSVLVLITLALNSCCDNPTESEIDYSEPLSTPPSLGEGTKDDPYRIANLGNLYWISINEEKWGKHFVQTEDIDASHTKTWFDGQGWKAIGYFIDDDNDKPFTGTYNGDDYTIDNLYINRPDSNFQGLFGRTEGALITNIGLNNVNITGRNRVGALVGNNRRGSIVSNSFSSGSVSGYWCVGGLVGGSWDASLMNSYSTGDVTAGSDNVGGLVGWNGDSVISNSYSIGKVVGDSGDIGGLIGVCVNSEVTNSYWDDQTSGQKTSANGERRTTNDMVYPYLENTYVSWCFQEIWSEDDSNVNNGYPYLKWER